MSAVLISVKANLAQGRAEQARLALQRALQSSPQDPDLNNAMAVVLTQMGQGERAVYFAERAAKAGPRDVDYLVNLARALAGAGRFLDAAGRMERVLELRPDDPKLALETLDHLINAGQGPACARLAARLSEQHPADLELCGLRAYYANYLPGAGDVAGLHRAFGRMLERTVTARSAPYPGARDPGRRIRIGLLSPDLRFSAVGFFIEPFFAHRDRASFELIGYSTALQEDAVGARLRAMADGWLHQPRWTDEQIARAVESDAVDVLIDLAGLTSHSRLGVMAMRPAPVLATYLGYPNTTGLEAIGWRIADAITDPPGEGGPEGTERVLRMGGCFVCYRPPDGVPEIGARPDRPVTFGSFNNLLKFNGDVGALWARVLGAVPGSRLIMKAPQLSDPGARKATLAGLERAGVDPSRVELLPPAAATREHLASYGAVDIALDTFPYGGTTTTCEALLMGVPVVTLRGESHRQRVGASLLGAIGLSDLVAATEEQYINAAVRLSADAGLGARRHGWRDRLLASPLCDGPGWCRRFEAALREAWVSYCG